MARIWITGQKTVTGREYKLAVLCADGCAFRIANPRACIERGLFGAARQFSRRFCIDRPGMKQVARGRRAFWTMRVRQSGACMSSRLVTMALYRFQRAAPHRHRKSAAFGDFNGGGRSPPLCSAAKNAGGDFFELVLCMREKRRG